MTSSSAAAATRRLRAFVADTRGANLVEYILLVGLVAILALSAFRQFGYTLRYKIDPLATTVSTIPDN